MGTSRGWDKADLARLVAFLWRVAGRGVLDKPDESEATLEDGMGSGDARVRVQAWGLQDWRIRGLARRLEHLET